MLRSPVTRLKRAGGAAVCVRQPLRFAARELSARRTTRDYRLRGSDLSATIRQPLVDSWVLEEVFRLGAYRFPALVLERLRGLGRPAAILDLGGHVGLFALWAMGELLDASVVSFEPDPSNAATLRRCIEANALDARWEVVEAAAGARDGRAELQSDFHLSQIAAQPRGLDAEHEALREIFPFLEGRDLLAASATEVAVRDALPALASADLVKIDIQGGEWDLLLDPRFEQVGAQALVIEVHPATCPHPEPHALVTDRLQAAGLVEVESQPGHLGERVVWAVRG